MSENPEVISNPEGKSKGVNTGVQPNGVSPEVQSNHVNPGVQSNCMNPKFESNGKNPSGPYSTNAQVESKNEAVVSAPARLVQAIIYTN